MWCHHVLEDACPMRMSGPLFWLYSLTTPYPEICRMNLGLGLIMRRMAPLPLVMLVKMCVLPPNQPNG